MEGQRHAQRQASRREGECVSRHQRNLEEQRADDPHLGAAAEQRQELPGDMRLQHEHQERIHEQHDRDAASQQSFLVHLRLIAPYRSGFDRMCQTTLILSGP